MRTLILTNGFFHHPMRKEGHLDAPSFATLARAGLFPRLEARPARSAGDKGDSDGRRVDRPSPRHLQSRGDVRPADHLYFSNELAQRLANLPVDAAIENASGGNRWCQLRETIQSTTLSVLGHARRQHRDWFDDNNAVISNLLADKKRLHKAYVNHSTAVDVAQVYHH
nr:unnamed protein product [Spirometra erinaceieuropaei]